MYKYIYCLHWIQHEIFSNLFKSHIRVILKPISLTGASKWRSKKPGIKHKYFFFFFWQRRSKAVNTLWLCSTQPAISKPPSPCWHQCNWHSPVALLAFKNLLQLALLLGLIGSCVWAKTRRMYLQREMYSWNIFSAFPIKDPTDLWVGDNYSVIEENKSNCTMCLASSDVDGNCKATFEYSIM